jgi:hypothetical protein
MSVDKKVNYEIQGGVKNYRPSKMVTVPKIAKSSPDTPTAKLAYITPEEEKILIDLNLYGSLKGKPNRGPGGIPSLEGDFGSPTGQASTGAGTGGTYSGGGGDYSSAETGNFSGFDGTGGTELPPGVNPTPSKEAQAIRNSFIAAGGGQRVNPGFFDSRNTVSPVELAMAKASNPSAFKKNRSSGLGGFISGGGILGAGIRNLGQMFGLGKTYNQPTYDMSKYSGLGVYNDTTRTPMHDYDFDTTQLGRARTLTNAGIPTQQGDYDIYGNKINELTGEVIDPITGEVITVLPGYPGNNDGGITTINRGDGGNNYTQNLVETINETVDDNIPDEDLLLRYLGADSTLNPEAAGVNSIAELRNLQMQRAKNIFTT